MASAHLPMNRRQLLLGTALGAAGTALQLLGGRSARAAGLAEEPLLAGLQACTPDDALARLQAGNARFVRAWAELRQLADPQQRMQALDAIWRDNCQIDPAALARGQKPFAALLCCADSRVEPGWLFACGSGELFQVRSAGNTAFPEAIASLEYAVAVLGVPLVLVMGHSGCGAVQAARSGESLTPLLEELVQPIRASLRSGDDLTRSIQANARQSTAQLTQRSTVLRDAVRAGTLTLRTAYCDIGSGRVSWL